MKIVKQDRYEKGDRIKIVDNRLINMSDGMAELCGKIVTIDSMETVTYRISEDEKIWWWYLEMIEGKVVEEITMKAVEDYVIIENEKLVNRSKPVDVTGWWHPEMIEGKVVDDIESQTNEKGEEITMKAVVSYVIIEDGKLVNRSKPIDVTVWSRDRREVNDIENVVMLKFLDKEEDYDFGFKISDEPYLDIVDNREEYCKLMGKITMWNEKCNTGLITFEELSVELPKIREKLSKISSSKEFTITWEK